MDTGSHFFRLKLRRGIDGSKGRCTFNFKRNWRPLPKAVAYFTFPPAVGETSGVEAEPLSVGLAASPRGRPIDVGSSVSSYRSEGMDLASAERIPVGLGGIHYQQFRVLFLPESRGRHRQ